MAARDIKVGDVLTLPFHTGDEPGLEDYEYEVEAFGYDHHDGSRGVRLIQLLDGKRAKTYRGYFKRSVRSENEINVDLTARAQYARRAVIRERSV